MISPDEARALGRDYVASHLIELNLDENPPPAYNFVPSEWFFFAVRFTNNSSVGSSHYVAVRKETGESRYAGQLGE